MHLRTKATIFRQKHNTDRRHYRKGVNVINTYVSRCGYQNESITNSFPRHDVPAPDSGCSGITMHVSFIILICETVKLNVVEVRRPCFYLTHVTWSGYWQTRQMDKYLPSFISFWEKVPVMSTNTNKILPTK